MARDRRDEVHSDDSFDIVDVAMAMRPAVVVVFFSFGRICCKYGRATLLVFTMLKRLPPTRSSLTN